MCTLLQRSDACCLCCKQFVLCVVSMHSPAPLTTVQADLVSVFEHLRGGRVREAQLSAAKYCHNHPGDPAEPTLLAVLQM